jgi:hypothetical protein
VFVVVYKSEVLPICTPFANNAPFLKQPTDALLEITAAVKVSILTLSPEAVIVNLPKTWLEAKFVTLLAGESVVFWIVTVPELIVCVPVVLAENAALLAVAKMLAPYCVSFTLTSAATLNEKLYVLEDPAIMSANTLMSLVPVCNGTGAELKSNVK